MTSATLVWRNLWRNRARTLLTTAALAVSLFLFTMLLAAVASMRSVAAASAAQLRLVVHHKTTMTKTLPLGMRGRLAALPNVASVCGFRWFGGRLENSQEQFPSMALETDTFPVVFDDFRLTELELRDWRSQRTAAVVGVGLAERVGCKPGDRIVLKGAIPPYLKLEFRVVGITRAAAYPNVFVFRLDYLVEALHANPMMSAEYDDAVNLYWVRVDSPATLDSVRGAIDATFARTPDPTMTEFEEAFVAQFTKMFGDLPGLVRNVGLIVVASILFVVGNTMSGAVRERVRELAVLKAVGYSTTRLVALLAGEAILMGLIGTIGCAAALLAFGISDAAGLSMPYFPIIAVSPAVVGIGVAVSVAVSLLAVIAPAHRVARLAPATTLRDVA